ncbi:MAG: Trm112 family protein [Pseudomonadales bacterium]|jgi:uncharacterized protein YbaR (Trm112 family)|nr:Trm112 family protein [Pseudomonadales bacterium]
MDSKLLELLVCPVTKTSLVWQRDKEELWCVASRLAYPIDDGIPVLIPEQARQLQDEEVQSIR